jgi:hypothetical protein
MATMVNTNCLHFSSVLLYSLWAVCKDPKDPLHKTAIEILAQIALRNTKLVTDSGTFQVRKFCSQKRTYTIRFYLNPL